MPARYWAEAVRVATKRTDRKDRKRRLHLDTLMLNPPLDLVTQQRSRTKPASKSVKRSLAREYMKWVFECQPSVFAGSRGSKHGHAPPCTRPGSKARMPHPGCISRSAKPFTGTGSVSRPLSILTF